MKAVILAGGRGLRLAEETRMTPKPLVCIGGYPIIWHIMKGYAAYGVTDFILCLGYKAEVIKQFFVNYAVMHSDITVDLKANHLQLHTSPSEDWRVTLVDTGLNTGTGGRLKRIATYLNHEDFYLTYADGVSDVAIPVLLAKHREAKKLVTVTAVQSPERFGVLEISNDRVISFAEKETSVSPWINAGFFVVSPMVIDGIANEQSSWERDVLPQLVTQQQLNVYQHRGFWQAMDTFQEKLWLEERWAEGQAPWKKW